MRTLIVHPRMSVFGGGERVAVHTIKAALDAGHEVYLACEQFNVPAFEDFFACPGLFERVSLLTYPTFRPITGRVVLYQRLLYHQLRLGEVIPKARDAGLVLSTQDAAYVPSVKIPVVQYCYFPEYFVHLESSPSSLFWRSYYWPAVLYYRTRVNRIDELISTSNYTRGFVREKWKRDSTTLYPPCPIGLYANLKERKEDLAITVGRVVPEKRMELFLEMAKNLPGIKFALVGSIAPGLESYFEQLKKAASSNVTIVNSPLRRVKDLVARAKIYVHCARSEHFGITIVEAMSAGCVPVVYDSGGPREIVTEDVGFRWKSVEEAVQQISTLAEDKRLQQKLSSAAASASEMYAPEVFEDRMKDVLAHYEQAN